MKIKMIGTGSMISADNPACYLINDKIMIDMPNGVVKILKKQNLFENIEYVFLTHMHGDHIFDLPFLFLDRLRTNKELTIFISKKWLPKIKKLVKLAFPRQYNNVFYNSNIKFVSNANDIVIDDLMFSSFEVAHGAMKPSFGYRVTNNKKVVTFTGDTGLCENIIDHAKESDYLISDCTLKVGSEKHMGIDNMQMLLENNPNLKIIPSHMGVSTKEELIKNKIKNLIVKEDMEEIEL